MSTFTDKEMIKEIKERIGSLDVRDNIERRAYEIALASLKAKPTAWTDEMELNDMMIHGRASIFKSLRRMGNPDPTNVVKLYRNPVVDAIAWYKDGWINCSERMPNDGQHVIILCDGAFVLYAQYRDGEFFDIVRNGDEFFETQSRNVTDWMPLPEPPQANR
ncbi:DUF551 domain-containing protein [Salmonella enterica]